MNHTEQPRRRSVRIPGFDYARAGAYFVTLCTKGKSCVLGSIIGDIAVLNELGSVVLETWIDLPRHYQNLQLDAFVVMPNHIHAIAILVEPVGAGFKPAPTGHGLPEIIRAFKTFSARRIHEIQGTRGNGFWQRNYYEHVIRKNESLDRIRRYIVSNPARWSFDRENPSLCGRV